MGKFFSILKNQSAVLITMLVLILLGATYFYIYIPDNEKNVQDRHFRCLQNIDYNVHTKIDNSTKLISSLLGDYNKINTDSLNNYIQHYPKNNFTLLPIILPPQKSRDNLVTIVSDANSKQFSLYANKKFLAKVFKDKNGHPLDSIGKLLKETVRLNDSVDLEMGIRYDIRKFIKPLLTPGVFDHYVVFYNDKENKKDNNDVTNKVVYESFPSGLSYLKKDSLLQTKNGIVTPGIRALSLSGTDYKVFTQAINVDANSEFIVAGLVTDKSYQREKNQLPAWLVLLLFTLALGTVVSLPWIKLYHMGNKDKLTVADGVSSVLVSMLLMSLLFFVIFNYTNNINYFSENKAKQSPLNVLANEVDSSFDAELNKAYTALSKYDSVYRRFPHSIITLGSKRASYQFVDSSTTLGYTRIYLERTSNDSDCEGLTHRNEQNIAVKEVYWLDTASMEQANWNTQNYNAPHGKYKDRKYFNSLKQDSFNYRGARHFYLDQVISKTRSVFTSILAIKLPKAEMTPSIYKIYWKARPSGKKVVTKRIVSPGNNTIIEAAMTFTVKSLDSVITPDGYQFAIVDNRGLVLYHSHPQRNLNERLEKEFADSSELVSSINAGTNTVFDANYYGKGYHVKIQPLKNLPYYLVILQDLEYDDARNIEPYAFTLSMFIAFMVLVLIQHVAVFLSSSKRSFFKRQFSDTSWIAPNRRSHHQYILAILANSYLIILLLIFFRFSSFLMYLYMLLFSVLVVSAFLTGMFALKYQAANDPRKKLKESALKCLVGLLILLDFSAYFVLDIRNLGWLLLFELLASACCWAAFRFGKVQTTFTRKWVLKLSPKWNYLHSFALMATTRLIITSGIPVAFFFIYSYNYEQNLDARYRQLTFATNLAQKFSPATLKNFPKKILTDTSNFRAIYPDNFSVTNDIEIGDADTDQLATLSSYSDEETRTVKVLNACRLLLNNTELTTNNLGYPPADGVTFFNKITYRHAPDGVTTRTYYKLGSGSKKYLALQSGDLNYPLLSILGWLIVLLVIAILIFYFVILNIIKKLFALNLPPMRGWNDINEGLLRDNVLNKLLLIVGPPGSGKLPRLKKMICDGVLYADEDHPVCKPSSSTSPKNNVLLLENKGELPKNVFIADMILIPIGPNTTDDEWAQCKKDAFNENNALVIIDHFEYNIKDANVNKIKLDFLESLTQANNCKIIIISTVHPLTFLDSFNDAPPDKNILKDNVKLDEARNAKITEGDLERWNVLLGQFRIIIEGLEKTIAGLKETDRLKKYMAEETRYAKYLKDMYTVVQTNLPYAADNEIDEISDSMAFNIQITSHYFYAYIWQSLTKEEKFILYDLAEDGLVNAYDDYNLVMLIRKGLVTKSDGPLRLFNKGFRNFILTAISNAELQRIKDQVKDTGKWNSLKAPLAFGIITILIFLMTSQQEVFNHVIAYVTTLGAGVPAVLSIFSLFGKNSAKSA